MDARDAVAGSRDAMAVERVFGKPYDVGGAVVIPTARVSGGAGGGESSAAEGSGYGTGFGLAARPAGVYVSRDGKVEWKPAVDANRIVLGAQVVAVVALLTLRGLVRAGGPGRAAGPRERRRRRHRGAGPRACRAARARPWSGRRA
jgi:uncharacterized spore protein YtfJ